MQSSNVGKLALIGMLVLSTVILGISWWIVSNDREDRRGIPTIDNPNANVGSDDRTTTTTALPQEFVEDTHSRAKVEDFPRFDPEQVILNVECQMRSGKGAASDVAVVTLFDDNGSKFNVLDNIGALVHGRLNFQPNHTKIGRRNDGSVVFGFGALRLNSKVFRERDTDEPVRIYHDDYVIYETAKAWDFGVADDGSSFFVHEPAPGGTSRLVVRNLDQGTQVEYDLGTRFTPVSDYSRSFTLNYSYDGSEIVFMVSQADSNGLGVYYFYPVEDSTPRRITVRGSWAATLTSSDNGYFIDRPNDLEPDEFGHVWQVTRRRIDVTNDERTDVWSKKLHIHNHSGRLFISQNGKWLGLSGYENKILDTDSGETIFSYPSAGNPEAKLKRLAPVLPEGATVADLGREGSMGFKGNTLFVYRIFGDTESCSTKPGEQYDPVRRRKCIKALRLLGLYREFYDIYEMDSIQLNSSPSYSVQVYSESNCMPANDLWRGLLDRDGDLVFRSERAATTNALP